jgi:DNA polymerase IV
MAGRSRSVLHLEVADFPVAIARIGDPSLRGRPVAVAPSAVRALVLAASAEARREGIRPGMPLREASRRCRGLRILPPDEALWSRATRAIIEAAERFSPIVEPSSLGRAYLDVTGTSRLLGRPLDVASRLRSEMLASLSLDAAVGLAVNKVVSRVAADLTEPSGLLDVKPGEEAPFLAPLPVERLPGVGREAARELRALNVRTVGRLAAVSADLLVAAFGPFGVILHQRAVGVDPRPVRPKALKTEVAREVLLSEDTNDRHALRGALRRLVEETGRELRLRGLASSRLRLAIGYADARAGEGLFSLPIPASDDGELWRAADRLLERVLERRVRVRRIGVRAERLASRTVRPRSLFDLVEPDVARRSEEALTAALDRIRDRHGRDAIRWGRVGAA